MISVVIPNWNGKKFLMTCLDSLANQSYRDFEIILVDNGSEDGSVQFCQSNYPEVKIIQFAKNLGFSVAVNAGIKESKGEFIALLNNDTEVDKKWLEELGNAAKNNPDVGFFASKMLRFDDRKIIDSCGDQASWKGKFTNYGRLKKDGEKYSQEKYVFGACAGAAMYRAELFDKIGLFDEDFFAYLEDIDISFRAQFAGYRCFLAPEAIVYHIGSATAGRRSAFNFKMVIKNRWHVIYKNFPTIKLWQYWPLIIYVEIRFILAAIKYGFLPDYFWAIKQALKEHSGMKKKRKLIQASRRVSINYLDSIMGIYE